MFPQPSWVMLASDTTFKHGNFEIWCEYGSYMSAPLIKDTTVVIKNLPPKVTKVMIQELLICKPLQIQPAAILSVDLKGVVDGKASCEINFDLAENASLVNLINNWFLTINNVKDAAHESRIIVEYPDNVFLECNEANLLQLQEDLENDSKFKEALATLKQWLEKGEVNKRNADSFYKCLIPVFNKSSTLNLDKMKSDTELREAKMKLKRKVEGLSESLKHFLTVLQNATRKRNWDHFSSKQRMKLDEYKKEMEELIKFYSQELLNQREEDEMDIDNAEKESSEIPDAEAIASLKERLNALLDRKAALEADLATARSAKEAELDKIKKELHRILHETTDLQSKMDEMKQERANGNVPAEELDNADDGAEPPEEPLNLSEQHVFQIGLLTSFLNLHSNGANSEYLASFLKDSGQAVTSERVEQLMGRFPNIFEEKTTGVGVNTRKLWRYIWPQPPADQSS